MSDWIARRLPPVSPEAATLYRIVFGALVLAFFLTHPVDAGWLERAAPESVLHRLALPVLDAIPAIADWVGLWIAVWAVVFIAGVITRTSFALLTVGALVWGVVYTMRLGAHSVGVLLLVLVCLLPARWRGGDRFAIWMPGFVLGTCLAAAAFAKIRLGGLAWITNGTVKYHFLTDSPDAPVDWGLRLAHYDGVAVLLSLGAIAIEALVVVGACTRRYVYRLAAGVATLGLLAGFALFQGLFWPAWWIVLISFLPWHRVRRTPDPTSQQGASEESAWGPASAGPAQAVVVVAVVLQQLIASAARIELAPLVSAFDMYSATYASPADYESKAGMLYWVAAEFADGKTDSCRVSREDADAVAAGDAPRVARVLQNCFDTTARLVRAVSVEGTRRAVDWARWRLGDEVRVPLAGPFPMNGP